MATWIKSNQLGAMFLATLVFGLLLVTASAFTVSAGLGLLVGGVCAIAGGHWVTYLRTTTGATR
jgi:uncharacterized membrane protein